jgi:hypothetical protein
MFIILFNNDPQLFYFGAFLDLILVIIVLVVFFGIGRNLKRIRQLLEAKNKLNFRKYAYKSEHKDHWSGQDDYFIEEGYISDKEIIGELEDDTPIIKNPEKK